MSVDAQQVDPEATSLEVYQAPYGIDVPELPYPRSAARLGQEGWVELNFMVDTNGKAYEAIVADNAGSEDFIDAALEHLEQTEFSPASIDGEPVDGSARMMYRFILENGEAAARDRFARRYRRFTTALRNDSQEDAEEELRLLQDADVQNNYEYAYLSLARYFYAAVYGTPLEQMEYLARALGESISRPENESFLGRDAQDVRRQLFKLQVNNGYYGEALDTLRLMSFKDDREGIEAFAEVIEQIADLRNDDQAFGVAGRISDNGYWDIELFKDEFWLTDLTGNIEQLKLRCQRSFVFFDFDPAVQYDVAEGAGECGLQVIGDAGATFTLVQQ